MKTLLITMLLMFAQPLMASGGAFYNPERSGEGISVYIRNKQLTFLFFTYYDDVM